MRRLGEVVRVVGSVAVVRAQDDSPPRIGETAIDESLATVGRVVDVMGPVDRPFLVVSTDEPPASLLNEQLYAR